VVRSFRAHPSALATIRTFIRAMADTTSLSERTTGDLVLAVSEGCANSILHTTTPDVTVSWTLRGSCVEITISDRGVFQRRVRLAQVDGGGGHGIPLMMALVDQMEIREGTPRHPGTILRLVKCQGR
jgi:anti-sigma regulatory factor (Ser/Thr protein kinase)